ncbi:hypothetical protein [Candidatus Nitrosopumilus sediminis]|uniref:Uncharacterized protein n=1 Tax=Candidatus Nitrosopumilus sediminis TaxID=1229909 RepID=K0BCC6_9ARCH|nr:hypothetical protein [Candidatus Nitrosopumilus sediminis]AFS82757.1 hypothetical protein NSED_04765 [Candidatus Nitrosopumilus sediminis]
MKNLVERFNSVNAVKRNLEKEIEETENTIAEYSNLLGEKIRINEEESADDPEFLALKEKLGVELNEKPSKKKTDVKSDETIDEESDETMDGKKTDEKKPREKKKKSKRKTSDKWYNLDEMILVYNGIGLKGELELYFKAIEELKARLENLKRTLATLNNVIEKGLKEDMGCIVFRGAEGILELAFLKSAGVRKKFSHKSIYTGKAEPVENIIKIGV